MNVGANNYGEAWLRWDLWEAENGTCSDASYHNQGFYTSHRTPVAGSTLYPAEQYSSCPAELMGLSNDWNALSTKIDAMQPQGNTNPAIGLQMGWQSSMAAPFTVPPKDPNYKYKETIILLTNGLNTQDRWYINASSIDAGEQKTCDNLKAAGFTKFPPCRSTPAAIPRRCCCGTAPAIRRE
jgi:hypothetical protein